MTASMPNSLLRKRSIDKVDLAHSVICRLMKCYLTKDDAIQLLKKFGVQPGITSVVWDTTIRCNRQFFNAYNIILNLRLQILRFNEMVSIQYAMMSNAFQMDNMQHMGHMADSTVTVENGCQQFQSYDTLHNISMVNNAGGSLMDGNSFNNWVGNSHAYDTPRNISTVNNTGGSLMDGNGFNHGMDTSHNADNCFPVGSSQSSDIPYSINTINNTSEFVGIETDLYLGSDASHNDYMVCAAGCNVSLQGSLIQPLDDSMVNRVRPNDSHLSSVQGTQVLSMDSPLNDAPVNTVGSNGPHQWLQAVSSDSPHNNTDGSSGSQKGQFIQ